MQNKKNNQKNKPTGIQKAAFAGGLLGIFVSVALCLLLSLALSAMPGFVSVLPAAGALCVCGGGFCGAFAAGRGYEKNGFLAGVLAGAVFLLPVAVCVLFFCGSGENVNIWSPLGLFAGVLTGAIAGSVKKESRKTRMKKLMKR